MTGTEIALIITATGALVASIGGVIVGIRNSRKIEEVHNSTNGKMELLIAEVRKSSYREGQTSGVEKLVDATHQASFAQGEKAEMEKLLADVRDASIEKGRRMERENPT